MGPRTPNLWPSLGVWEVPMKKVARIAGIEGAEGMMRDAKPESDGSGGARIQRATNGNVAYTKNSKFALTFSLFPFDFDSCRGVAWEVVQLDSWMILRDPRRHNELPNDIPP